jgi:hypothetical protein
MPASPPLASLFVSSLTDVCVAPPKACDSDVPCLTPPGMRIAWLWFPGRYDTIFITEPIQISPKSGPRDIKSCGAVVARRSYKIRQTLMTPSWLCGCRGFEVSSYHTPIVRIPLLTSRSAPPGLEITLLFCPFFLFKSCLSLLPCIGFRCIALLFFFTPASLRRESL